MTPFTVTLPWPPRELNPNYRCGWRKKHEVAQRARHDAFWLTRVVPFYGIDGDLIAKYTFNPPSKHRRDQDNTLSSCKSFQDGVMDALGIDDRQIVRTVIEWGIVEREKGGEVVLELSTTSNHIDT